MPIYQTPLPHLLDSQLRELLPDPDGDMPVVEVSAQGANRTVTLFYSGGGWRDLDRAVGEEMAEEMAKLGYPLVGVDTLRYFWQHKSPAEAAADLSRLMARYRQH